MGKWGSAQLIVFKPLRTYGRIMQNEDALVLVEEKDLFSLEVMSRLQDYFH